MTLVRRSTPLQTRRRPGLAFSCCALRPHARLQPGDQVSVRDARPARSSAAPAGGGPRTTSRSSATRSWNRSSSQPGAGHLPNANRRAASPCGADEASVRIGTRRHVGRRLRLGGRRLGRPGRHDGERSTPPRPRPLRRRAPPRSTSSASAYRVPCENSPGEPRGDRDLPLLVGRSQISFTKCRRGPQRKLGDPRAVAPTRRAATDAARRPPAGGETRDHTMQSVTLGIALCG